MVRHDAAGVDKEKTSVDEYLIIRKAAAYGTIDMLWQYGCQYPDRFLQGTKAGKGCFDNEWMGNDVTAMLYPVVLAVLAYWLAQNVFLKGHKKDESSPQEYDQKTTDSFEICHTVFKGIAGWTAAYYFANWQEWGVGATAAAVGVGAALPGFVMTLGYQAYRGRLNWDKTTQAGVTACATFVAGAAWLANSMLPEWLGGNKFSEELLRGFIAPALTLLVTAFCAGLVLYRDERQSATSGNRLSQG